MKARQICEVAHMAEPNHSLDRIWGVALFDQSDRRSGDPIEKDECALATLEKRLFVTYEPLKVSHDAFASALPELSRPVLLRLRSGHQRRVRLVAFGQALDEE